MSELSLFEKWNAPKLPKPLKKKNAGFSPVSEKPKESRPFPLTFVGKVPSKQLFEGKQVLVVGNAGWGAVILKEGAVRVVSYVSDLPEGGQADDKRIPVLPMPSGEFPCPDGVFDTVFLSDALSEVEDPGKLLAEIARVSVPSALVCIGETPYRSPHGSGLNDVIRMPYAHLLFGKKTIIRACADAWEDLPAEEKKKKMRGVSEKQKNGKIIFLPEKRGMSGTKLKRIVSGSYFETKQMLFRPIEKGIFPTLAKIPGVRDFASEKIVMVLEKKPQFVSDTEKKKKEKEVGKG